MIRVAMLFALVVVASVMGMRVQTTFAASAFTVTKQNDTLDGTCDDDCSLREAIFAANADPDPSTITVPASADHYLINIGIGDDSGKQGDFDILTEVSIQGAGIDQTIIDGNARDTVFQVHPGAALTLTGITVTNGLAAGRSLAGGIFAQDGLKLYSSKVAANNGPQLGAGGIYADAPLTIADSQIIGNVGGNEGVGGIFTDRETQIRNTTISGNTASGVSSVGGFDFENNGDLTDVTISDNHAMGESSVGGLYTYFNVESGLNRVSIAGNSAEGNYAVGGWWNNAHVNAMDIVVDGNHGGDHGVGGVFVECCGSEMNLSRATISGNTGAADAGGGFWNEDRSELTNVTVSGNSAGAAGAGGIYNAADLTLLNVTVTGNSTGTNGNAGLWNDDLATVRNSIVDGNGPADCLNAATITSQGGNISAHSDCGFAQAADHQNIDPLLFGLADNGGFSKTHAPMDGSPAIDASVSCPPPTTDQRGIPRPQGSCDSGAYETGVVATVARTWGDILCNGGAGVDDAAAIVRTLALGQPDGNVPASVCPGPVQPLFVAGWFDSHLWGDINCDGKADLLDALAIVRGASGLEVETTAPCPTLGQTVQTG